MYGIRTLVLVSGWARFTSSRAMGTGSYCTASEQVHPGVGTGHRHNKQSTRRRDRQKKLCSPVALLAEADQAGRGMGWGGGGGKGGGPNPAAEGAAGP